MAAFSPQDAAETILERARGTCDVDGCIVLVDEDSSANLRWANNTLTTNGVTRQRRITVIATVPQHDGAGTGIAAGVVSRSVTADTDVTELVDAAVGAARSSTPAEDAAPLVEPGDRNSPAWSEPPHETSGGVFTDLVTGLGAELSRADKEGRLLFGFAEHQMRTTYLATSTGVRLRHDQPTGKIELTGRSTDHRRSAWVAAGTRTFQDVDIAALHADIAQRLGWAERSIELPPGRYETLLPPTAVADLMIYLYWSAGARDAHDGRTVFSKPGGGTRVGDQLTGVPLTLRSDPFEPGLECEPFVIAHTSTGESSVFDNGLPLGPTAWIDRGRLAALLQTRYSARLTGLPVTPAIDNLILTHADGQATLSEMIASSRRSLLVTSLWYIREVDPQTLLLTGLTRDGLYLVEDGEVVAAVNNFRFNESPVDLLARVTEGGGTVPCLPREWNDYFTRTAMPPLRVADFNMSTVSQAS